MVRADGTLRQIDVQLGLRNEQHAEVVRGDVQLGDRVATGLQRDEKQAARPPSLPGTVRFR